MRIGLIATAGVLLATAGSAQTTGTIRCEFEGRQSRAVVTNNRTFQTQCVFECRFDTAGNEHVNRGEFGLNPGQTATSPGTAEAVIRSVRSSSVRCGSS